MRLHHVIALLAVLLGSTSVNAQLKYFLPDTLDDRAEFAVSHEEWYAEHLQVLKEPSLWEQSKSQETQSYRFLWLRSFHRPVAVRLDVNEDGTGFLTTKITNGQGGYESGRLVTNRTRRLEQYETDHALAVLEEWGFWNLPAFEKPEEKIGADGQRITIITLDGAAWVLEGVKAGQYHVVNRTSPKDGPLRWLGEMMLFDLAKLKLLYQEVY